MSSSATSSKMEEKHFGFTDSISDKRNINVNDKITTKDFLNTEVNVQNISLEPSLTKQDKTDITNNDEELLIKNDNLENKEKYIVSPDSETVFISNQRDYQSIDLNVESQNKDSDSEDIASAEIPVMKQVDPSIDDNLPSTVTLLRTPDGGKCYVVGTAHFSIESQNDVSRIIQAVQPHIVMVELCRDRIHILELDEDALLKEAKSLDFNKIMYTLKENGLYKGIFYILLLNMSVHLTKVLGLAPGGEFRRALAEAKKIPNCHVHMGDRPIKITFARALSFLTWWQKIKFAWQLLTDKDIISQKDVEKYKCQDSVEEIMAELAGEYPALGEVFVKERDIYLTHSLQLACKPKIGIFGEPIPVRVVGVVGIGHTFGIIQNWGKVEKSQILPIMSIPPPSLSGKVLKFTIKASIVGTVIYIGYKFIPMSINIILSLKSSVGKLINMNVS
ncbi:PREDICTED: traB domain-containing protein-like [Ceratosolen solmsi marchali]|uniref:TraB domain-containing protein-like n=1 Tax=Ceratosolen solmsi marchali TaxID=326594 RepID=A0AAJ6YCQ1_9HYME|nr:PREDICTED: traB domain-containing protein-like [Ceratosolen solmsi marchali]